MLCRFQPCVSDRRGALLWQAMAWLVMAAALLLASDPSVALTDPKMANFNHASTGYPLTGAHLVQSCESCHIGGTMKGTPRTCQACHAAGTRYSKGNTVVPQRHIPLVVGCGDCHNTQTFSRTSFRHGVVTNVTCQTCHNGLAATGLSQRHITVPAGQQCVDCHRSTTSWLPTVFNHTQVRVVNNCFSCHDGRHDASTGRPVTHVPGLFIAAQGIGDCDSCHLDGRNFTDWVPARVHQFVNITALCNTCHTGAFPPAVAQPRTPSHVGASPLCETCHKSTNDWFIVDLSGSNLSLQSAKIDARSPVKGQTGKTGPQLGTVGAPTPGRVNLLTATLPPPRHIPLPAGATCTACHRTATDMATTVVMNHSAVRNADCKTCHGGTYTAQGARAPTAEHIPYKTMLLNGSAMDCDDCHKAFAGASWASVKMNHNNTLGGGAGLCKGCHQAGTPFAGQMSKKALAHTGGTAKMAQDCSSSGCHGPLGRTGARFASWR